MTRITLALAATGLVFMLAPAASTPARADSHGPRCFSQIGIGNAYAALFRARGRRAKRRAKRDWRKRINNVAGARGKQYRVSGRTSMSCTAIAGHPHGMSCRFWATACR